MIARQWIGETRESDAEEYAKYLEETADTCAPHRLKQAAFEGN